MDRLCGKTALVTGAASGIGRATCIRLGQEGAQVMCVDINASEAEKTAIQIRELGGKAAASHCDVAHEKAIIQTVESTLNQFSELHIVCNVAGIIQFENTHSVTLEDWHRVVEINLTGTFLMCRETIPHLLKTKGAIVNVASTAALAGHAWTAAYSASKGGVVALTHTIAIEYAKQGIRANTVCPGSIETPMVGAFQLPEGADAKLLRRIMTPDGKFRGPETVAASIAFLASEDAAHINGAEIRVDGGALS